MPPALLELVGLAWERPLGFLALVLPLALLLGARRAEDSPRIATAWLALWRGERSSRPPSLARPRRIALSVWLLALALACGALALAGPVPRARAPTWHLVLDRSPSMYLAPPSVDARARTRIDDAIERASEWITAHGRGGRTVWIAVVGGEEQRAESSAPPSEWLSPPPAPLAEPAWSRYDDARTIWVSDHAPDEARTNAGLVVSGATIAPGAISQRGDVRTIWDGARLLEENAPPGRVAIAGEPPRPLARVLEAWAAERALAVERTSADAGALDARLVLRTTHAGATHEVDTGRDGWRARGTVHGDARHAGSTTWLAADGVDVVTSSPGRVDSAWSAMGEPSGDAAAFAVSWGMLFDAACLPAAGVVSFTERAQAGPALVDAPRAVHPEGAVNEPRTTTWLSTWLVLASVALVLAAFAVRR